MIQLAEALDQPPVDFAVESLEFGMFAKITLRIASK